MHRRDFMTASLASGMIAMGHHTLAKSSDFYVPPEEHPHELTFMQWPASHNVHRDRIFSEMLQDTILDIANTISEFETVVLLADRAHHNKLRRLLSRHVTLWDIPTEDLWARDSGPICAINTTGQRAIQNIQFNGWGGKQVHRHDGKIAALVADRLGLPLIETGLQGEAGGVEQDGHGLLMAHESSWIINNRNPGQSKAEVSAALLSAYGAHDIIWAPGLFGEDITDYHIDSLARFTGPGRVLINMPDDPDPEDPFHSTAQETLEILQSADLDITIIPEPNRKRVDSLDFVASYANYYVCNGGVIMAQFGDPETDAIAQQALRTAYPGREIVALNVDPLGEVGGGIHCATHELPKA